MKKRFLIVVPTYQEHANIVHHVTEVFREQPYVSMLIVDDNSPDGTALRVRELQPRFPELHLLQREKKEGLGRAYIAGFEWGLKNGYDYLIQMDADGSHRPQDLGKILNELVKYDFVVGSRRTSGGEVRNWEWYRRLLSWGGNMYAALLLNTSIGDWTGGFNGWSRKVLETMNFRACHSQGYSFQIEMKLRALRLNFVGFEVPIIFEERREGVSKMSLAIITEALHQVWRLRKQKF